MKSLIPLALAAVFFPGLLCAQNGRHDNSTIPEFDLSRYLGKWYEIARFDFAHEKDMDNVTARYSLNKDGSIRVENRGYDYKKGEWKESIGKAKFQGRPTIGSLKVSFFGPFYSGYNIIALDPNYLYSLVVGKNYDYLCFQKQNHQVWLYKKL